MSSPIKDFGNCEKDMKGSLSKPKFIEVTRNGEEHAKILLNAATIISIKRNGNGSLLLLNKDQDSIYICVEEPYEDIKDMLEVIHEPTSPLSSFDDEDIAVEYGRRAGYNWVAKDKTGSIYFYVAKPSKGERSWSSGDCRCLISGINLPFLSWKDEHPVYIGDEKQ